MVYGKIGRPVYAKNMSNFFVEFFMCDYQAIHMKLPLSFKSLVVFAAYALIACLGTAHAAIPQPGLWIVDAEATGKPGRGFQIDLQNRTLVFTYYGYKFGGAPTFFLASGSLSDAGVFESQLMEYQGGTTFGGPRQDAVATNSAGLVSVRFVSPTTGLVTFPGEAEKSISRFSFADTSVRLKSGNFDGQTYGITAPPVTSDSTKFTFTVSNGSLTLSRATSNTGTCVYTGAYTLAGTALQSNGTYSCSDASNGTYRAEGLQVDENGLYSGAFYRKKAGTTSEIKEVHAGARPIVASSQGGLSAVQSFEYVIAANLNTAGIEAAIAGSPADLVILGGGVTKGLNRIQADPSGTKLIFGYVDVAEASAGLNPALFRNGQAPTFLGKVNPGFPGLYSVQYWTDAWKAEVFSNIDALISNGYDGIFLDVLSGDNEWSLGNSLGNTVYSDATPALMTLVGAIRAHVDANGSGRKIYLLGNNPQTIALQSPSVLTKLDAIFNECVFYCQSPTNGAASVYVGKGPAEFIAAKILPLYRNSGLPVFGNDYPAPLTQANSVIMSLDFYSLAGWIPSVTTALQTSAILSGGPFIFTANQVKNKVTGANIGVNYLLGGASTDAVLIGGPKGDFFIGGPGTNTILGGAGDDTIYAHPSSVTGKNKLLLRVAASVIGTATRPSLEIAINGEIVQTATPVLANFGAGTQTIDVDLTRFSSVALIRLTITGASFADKNNFSNFRLLEAVYNGNPVALQSASISNGGIPDSLFSNNGTVTFDHAALPTGSAFPENTASLIDGGGGKNVVVYRAALANYTISKQADGSYHVTSRATAEGPDTLVNIQTLRFQDQDVSLP
jgi:endo-alpha-1,4-polygalactosaminidase (GH114 family)